ncbi:MAG: alginate export family protein [Candidatus Hydrogenedentes bacterium]|nr:alginate export family protein [Candidatus Hydrogenedentota bacterium]
MRLTMTAILMAVAMVVATPVFAELQNVEVGGSLRIRGNAYSSEANLDTFADENGAANNAHVEQRTTISVSADFTDGVSAFIELSDYGAWGEAGDFGGVDDTAGAASSAQVYQAYIQLDDAFDFPLMIRIGRQEVMLGSEWLVGNNDNGSNFQGLSFDAIAATYTAEDVGTLSVGWAKLVESASIAGPGAGSDSDVDLYVVYGSYTGMEDITIDAYYILARMAATGSSFVDDLATIGARVAADYMGFDIEAEAAFQSGDAESKSATAEFDGTAANVEVGYTFDMDYQPRVYVGYAFFEGATAASGDVGFQRLFSDWEYGEFLDGGDLGNVTIIRAGASAQVTESIDVALAYALYTADEVGAGDDELGSEIALYANYAYSEDLSFGVGYAFFMADKGSAEGHDVRGQNLQPASPITTALGASGIQEDDASYFFFETSISF